MSEQLITLKTPVLPILPILFVPTAVLGLEVVLSGTEAANTPTPEVLLLLLMWGLNGS